MTPSLAGLEIRIGMEVEAQTTVDARLVAEKGDLTAIRTTDTEKRAPIGGPFETKTHAAPPPAPHPTNGGS